MKINLNRQIIISFVFLITFVFSVQSVIAASPDDEVDKVNPSKKSKIKANRTSRFIDNGDSTVTDTKTGLMWASKDNGKGINWLGAKKYCDNFTMSGYKDWRLPTVDELSGLYNENQKDGHTPLITLTGCCPLGSEADGSRGAFPFDYKGNKFVVIKDDLFRTDDPSRSGYRALPVRRILAPNRYAKPK